MWIEQVTTKSGEIRYKYCERYQCPYSGKTKRVSLTYSSNSKQTQKLALIALMDKINKATNTDFHNDITLVAIIKEYLDSKRGFRKASTQYSMDNLYKTLIQWFPEDILLSKLTTYIIQTTFDNFARKYSYNYTKAGLSLVRQSLKYARRMDYISNISFIDNVELQRPVTDVDRIKRQREKFLTKAELKDVLQQLDTIHHHVSLLCEFQSLTGLRFGEMVALRNQDYDSTTIEIDINGTMSSSGSFKDPKMRLPPKNVYSIRKIKLDKRANQILNYFITAKKARRLWKSKFEDNDYIFVTDGGLPYDLHYINKILKKLNFHKHISTHTFRHTHISLLAESNVPLKAIMERVGHNEPRTTLAVYTHVTDEMKKEMNLAINSIGKVISNK